jgi:peptidoglycan/xylan/chitin deacetylase (PgdA/CDA1 family)
MRSLSQRLAVQIKQLLLPLKQGDLGYSAAVPCQAVLTYDDGPSQITAPLLDSLAEQGVKSTFFVLAAKAAKAPELIRRMYSEGHEIALHGYEHINFAQLSPERAQAELKKALDILVSDIGLPREAIESFRPPWGFPWRLKTWYKVKSIRKVLDELDLRLTFWSYDSGDLRIHEGRLTTMEVSSRVAHQFNGGIVLLHDIHPGVVPVTNALIQTAAAKGISFKTASEWRATLFNKQTNRS